MNKKILLFAFAFIFAFSFGQKNKYGNILNSRKLGYAYKDVKDKDKDDYYQQFYWLMKAEELGKYPHLKDIRPQVLYEFVKEINPPNPTKELSVEDKKFREAAELSLNQYFSKRDLTNPVMILNLETYVDPSEKKYFTEVNPERVVVMLPKVLYSFTTRNKKENTQKTYYLYIDQKKNEHHIVDIIPSKEDKKFYATLKQNMGDYEFPAFLPTVTLGDKKDKVDADFYYITPLQISDDNIVYRTKDFVDYEMAKVKKEGEAWVDLRKSEYVTKVKKDKKERD